MKAMIFAAGLGTRLRPLTNSRPKALIEVDGAPLLEHVVQRLLAAGVTEVLINLHHFPEQIKAFVEACKQFGIRVEFSEEPALLDTGGGLKQAAAFFDDGQPFLAHNVDILSDIDLKQMLRAHESNAALATLAVKPRQTSRYLVFDQAGLLCGWKSLSEEREIVARQPVDGTRDLGFCGIHALSPKIFDKMSESGAFSIIDTYLRLAGEGERIQAFRVDGAAWRDVGKLSQISR